MDADRFSNLCADGLDRVEGGHRLLKHHTDIVATNAAECLFRQRGDFLILQVDGAGCGCPFWQ